MKFSQLIQAVRSNPAAVVVPSAWAQGRASFGGLVAALAYEAMSAKVSDGRPVRSLAITFVGPMEAEVPASFEAEVLREGKAVSQMFCRAVQNGQTVAVVQGSFGASRESAIDVAAEPAPVIKPAEECQELPFLRGVTPEFTRFLAMRWGIGSMPFTNNPAREMGGWVRFRGDVEDEPVEVAHLLALVDAWPPAVLPHLRSPVPGSSLTWTIEFVQPLPAVGTLEWCLYRAEIEHARDGYGHVSARLWTPSGELVALSRQTVTVFG
ncbi:acyl-CoA thioesterase [Pseudomonas solani]|uniref:acyl-CoA thioesterase n=1 Tax=Pseudomonas TaxID=286 RepID=UPI0003964581|nr:MULTISPECIES: thioesterase family protein [unclassified Pseudomonas]EQM68420.1 acyl-CoA thioesterase [Pseudomonas alcaligenes OT 69]MBB4819572.1 acyl-CoA thioesterase II [Pseudomonas alcaligenes]MDN4148056.1 thioesterase family protein [Pseudomonas tohonis]MDU9412066.1 thioesterase family protein [Pseudomonas sp. zfem005]WCD82388.1 thioesterase family protein [Pseudomonas sp. TUM22785]